MSNITRVDYNFGRIGKVNTIYVNNEYVESISLIDGWEKANTKTTNTANKYEDGDASLPKGNSNYLRTCLEHNTIQNSTGTRGNNYPFCFAADPIIPVRAGANGSVLYWPNLPRYDIDNNKWIDIDNSSVSGNYKTGFQIYICPKAPSIDQQNSGTEYKPSWPEDFHTLKQTTSNAFWPIRPSNGEGGLAAFSPPKPYHARIRIPLSSLKRKQITKTGAVEYRPITEIPSEVKTKVTEELHLENTGTENTVNVTKIRGFINLVNPDAVNGSTDAKGNFKWPHNFNQIVYRYTSNEYGEEGRDNENNDITPLLTVFNSEAAGYTNIGNVNNYQSYSSYYGDGVPFEVPVKEGQQYLVFDIYTDACDNIIYQTNRETQWWQLTWSFESYSYRPISNTAGMSIQSKTYMLPAENKNNNSSYVQYEEVINEYAWPRKQYFCKWTIAHDFGSDAVVNVSKLQADSSFKLVIADVVNKTISEGSYSCTITFRLKDASEKLPEGSYKAVLYSAKDKA
jgi:hypothetical protein